MNPSAEPLFPRMDATVDFPAQERAILDFWQRTNAFEILKQKNLGKPKWSFLDGPITANNPMGVHHAWGRTYKDAYQRYFAMTGHELRYQNGFDCQGLWVEVEVEKELKLGSKRAIEELVPGDRDASIDRFVELCKARVDRFARVQTEQSIRLGYWMNWDRTDADWAKPPGERKSYFTMSEENNYTIWAFLKKCHARGLIYRGSDVMPWSGRGGSAYSQQEVNDGRKLTSHLSPFVRFPLKGRDKESLLIWTTTPWTLTSNVAAAVNPQLEYVRVKLTRDGTSLWLAKENLEYQRLGKEFKEGFGRPEWSWPKHLPKLKPVAQMFKELGGYTVEETVLGEKLVGLEYHGPFDDLPAQQADGGFPSNPELLGKTGVSCHRVIDGGRDIEGKANVVAGEGTGIVHIAPGCGDIDHKLGKALGLVEIAPLDDEARFYPEFGEFAGMDASVRPTAEKVLEVLKSRGLLVSFEDYPHVYPHCWRTGVELVFRPVDEWFIDMKWRQEIVEVVNKVTFLPEEINGRAREADWLKNMGDWMISKKRYWGLALPIWVDDITGEFDVIGSFEELKERAVEGWDEFSGHTPHRPWIDRVKLRNPNTGNLMSRIPDVGNPWLDAGIVPYSTMGYNTDRAKWEEWFPADFIVESFPGQFRNWFYSLLALSTMMENRPPFKVLMGHALVLDETGGTMSKSKGNSIEFLKAADEFGADVCRWLYARQIPSSNLYFGEKSADEVRSRFVLKLWHTCKFFCDYAHLDGFDPYRDIVPVAERTDMDRWILSDLQLVVAESRRSFEAFALRDFALEVEKYIDDKLSNWYVRRSRRRFWKNDDRRDQLAGYQTLHTVLLTLTKLIAPVVPFLAETLYGYLKADPKGTTAPISVHLCDYPVPDETLIDEELSKEMDAVLKLVTLGSACRNSAKIKVRQPLALLSVFGTSEVNAAVERFQDLLCDELNVKEVRVSHDPDLREVFSLNLKTAASKMGPNLKAAQAELAAMKSKFVNAHMAEGTLELAGVALADNDILVTYVAPEGWTGVADKGTQVKLDIRISEELAVEGAARDIVRLVQDQRKKTGLEVEDRIFLYLDGDSARLKSAISTHRDYIAAETLAVVWMDAPEGATTAAKIDKDTLTIGLKKAETI